jgi:hypothetical protein
MTKRSMNGTGLAGGLLAATAIAVCLAIGTERAGAFGFRGGFHGGDGFGVIYEVVAKPA